MPIIPSDVQDLVDNPGELLHVELKEWLDLTDDVARAKLARHLAALSNHGGELMLGCGGNPERLFEINDGEGREAVLELFEQTLERR